MPGGASAMSVPGQCHVSAGPVPTVTSVRCVALKWVPGRWRTVAIAADEARVDRADLRAERGRQPVLLHRGGAACGGGLGACGPPAQLGHSALLAGHGAVELELNK